MKKAILAAALFAGALTQTHAAIVISEIAPWSSGDSSFEADWFELTNTGSSAVNIQNWKVDDDSASFSTALSLTGISSIGAGESVIFLEGNATNIAGFKSTWFGANVPAGLQVGSYSGSKVGLSTDGDQVNIYNGSGVLQASVAFGASDSTSPFQTFDNANGPLHLSQIGVDGAFAAANDPGNVGSPGVTAAPVPEPGTAAFGLCLLGMAISARRRANRA